jgi:hypothetical protein
VPHVQARLKECARMGRERVLGAAGTRDAGASGRALRAVETLSEALRIAGLSAR